MKQTLIINNETYELFSIKNKFDSSHYNLVVKNLKTKKKQTFYDVFSYNEGWSQGMGRSVFGYYLNVKHYGSVGNGSRVSRKVTPYLSYDILDYLKECMSGKHYDKDSSNFYKLTI